VGINIKYIKYKHLPLSDDIVNLNTKNIENNLYNYTYHSRYLKKLNIKNFDKEDLHYISTYSSFVGEVYENIIYELLIRYAIKEPYIKKFVLKGPHQNGDKNKKNGLLIDRNGQIVYKSGYKDVSEFDGLFFTKDELWFVESTIVKTTTSLKKRLKKKKALLELIFPNLTIRSLIILSSGVIGANSFPSYCTIWITKQLNDTKLINNLINIKDFSNKPFEKLNSKKLIETKNIKISIFKYFETLYSILKNIIIKKSQLIDLEYLSSSKIDAYFDIFSKFYIGFIDINDFLKIYPKLNIEELTKNNNNINENKIIVTIEKSKNKFILYYYAKLKKGKLKKFEILENSELKLRDKDPKGFTASEIKFMKYIWKDYHKFSSNDILDINILLNKKPQKKSIFILSDNKQDGVNNLPTFMINFLPSSNIDITTYDAIIFTSKNGILSLDSFNNDWKKIPSYAISYKTAQIINEYNGILQYTGKNGHGNKFAYELIPLLKDKKVLYIKPKNVVSKLVKNLLKNGIKCDELVTYETICKTYSMDNKPPKNSIIILSSPSTLNCFLDIFGWDESYFAIAIGKTTTKFIPEYIQYKVSPHTSLKACIKLAKTL
jgi:uroporphyrinogen-III synthase